MKLSLVVAFVLVSFCAFGQSSTNAIDLEKWEPPYKLNTPEGWGSERFLIPIEFAPSIPYKGVEDLRFAPGWADAKSNEYWTYAFLWYIESSPEINAGIIEQNLKDYYTGLVGRNIDRRKIAPEKVFPVKTSFRKVTAVTGDRETFSGTIDMLDYMSQTPMRLNCLVHLKACAKQNMSFIFFEISPKPFTDNVWKSLDELAVDFACNK